MFPPKESCRIRVSFESLYGICWFFPSTNADITFPKALNERLIFAAYFIPSSFKLVLLCLSDPAKSTKLSFPTLNFYT